nr:FtsX-like permease family protein [Pleionea sp. CnH1-48]
MSYKIALLNVFRNYRRSLITLTAIVFGCVSLVVFGGFVASMYEGMRENLIRSQLGHIQIYAKGYNQFGQSEPEKYLISKQQLDKATEILNSTPGILLTTARLNFSGLISDGKNSVAVLGEGVLAENEALLSSAISLKKGEDLFEEDESGALLGEGLFGSLDTNTGEYLTLLSSTADGAINATDIQVTGVISTGIRDVDSRLVRANLALVQQLMYTDKVTRVVVLLEDTELTDSMIAELEVAFNEAGLKLEMKSWSDLAGYYHEVVNLFNGVFGFIKIIVLFIVALSISNTMLMAVMERTREIGTIRAMGGTPGEVIHLFLLEALYLGVLGSIAGVLVGALSAHLITLSGWMMPTPPGSSQDFPIRVFIETEVLLETLLLGVAIALLSSLYPAIKASRLQITNALRFA